MSFKDTCHIREERYDFFTGRDLLVELARGFSTCESDFEKREYVGKLNGNKEIDIALQVFSTWWHSDYQDSLYRNFSCEIRELRKYRKSLKCS